MYLNVQSKEDVRLLNKFIIEHYERENIHLLLENDSCMKKHSFVAQYWDAVQNETFKPDLHDV